MPNIFKALASIAAWILFISALVGFVISGVDAFTSFGEEAYPFEAISWSAWNVATLLLAVVVMRLRQKME